VCLLDPILHTSENVRPLSFTLFSVVCALGCAISDTQRDRSLYSTLLALAESNIKWSIATSVKSVETIQAIFTMEYWSPVHETQKDDPYWLHISHVRNLPPLHEPTLTLCKGDPDCERIRPQQSKVCNRFSLDIHFVHSKLKLQGTVPSKHRENMARCILCRKELWYRHWTGNERGSIRDLRNNI